MDLQTGHLEDRDHALIILQLLLAMKFFRIFFRIIFPKKNYFCVPAEENQDTFTERCSLICGVL